MTTERERIVARRVIELCSSFEFRANAGADLKNENQIRVRSNDFLVGVIDVSGSVASLSFFEPAYRVTLMKICDNANHAADQTSSAAELDRYVRPHRGSAPDYDVLTRLDRIRDDLDAVCEGDWVTAEDATWDGLHHDLLLLVRLAEVVRSQLPKQPAVVREAMQPLTKPWKENS